MSSEIIRAVEKQSPSFLMNSLPDDLIVDILARVPRCNYPNLSLVSKHFWSLVASPELYARRSVLGCTEPSIYVMLGNSETGDHILYILRCNRLDFIRLLPPRSSIIAVGSKIYVFGGFYDLKLTTTVLSIDYRFHMVQALPSMPMNMAGSVIDIIDQKIYIIGYGDNRWKKKVMVVFDTKTKMWEREMTEVDIETGYICANSCVVMADKMYMRGWYNSFVYIPKENIWETDARLNSEKWHNACLIDDVLYYYDYYKKKLRAYDIISSRVWKALEINWLLNDLLLTKSS